MIVSYDVDGVLADKPPLSEKKWGHMNGQERNERKEYLKDWYRNATPLIQPKEEKFFAISARKAEPVIYNITMEWMSKHYPERVLDLYLLRDSRTVENAAIFKVETIISLNVERHYEDNKKVLRAMLKRIPPWVELYFWEKGMTDPIPYNK
ncbi:hypothetical protein UFOVP49_180 [uncultured Caudovirales phage]|uniref:Uncharacterized protein n=1 Tax=uncultured Caudovirales phage TaxID=2100421 RepID=A0A6J5KSU6_9CAUD|nr:hypothetical protein UFOVP49_180 [uncultured Caudovirales phage]